MKLENVKIIMLGTGSPRPNLKRIGASQVLLVNDLPILIDCSEGTTRHLLMAGIQLDTVQHLWLTHLHSDHISGYIQFLFGGWTDGRRKLTVIGPVGTRKFHNTIIELLEDDISYRVSSGFPPEGLLDVKIIEVEQPGQVSCDLPLKASAERMIHNVPTFAYRFESESKVVVFSGDTAPNPALIKFAEGADALVHDSSLVMTPQYQNTTDPVRMKLWNQLQKEHCSPAQAAYTAREAKVKKLILTHFVMGMDEEQVYQDALEVFSGSIIVSKDLQEISLD